MTVLGASIVIAAVGVVLIVVEPQVQRSNKYFAPRKPVKSFTGIGDDMEILAVEPESYHPEPTGEP